MDNPLISGNAYTKRNMDTPLALGNASTRRNMDTPLISGNASTDIFGIPMDIFIFYLFLPMFEPLFDPFLTVGCM